MKFETDYIISWDISKSDYPCITVSKVFEKEKQLQLDILGISHEQSGVVSLRQLLEENSAEEKAKYQEAFELLSTLSTCNTCVKQKICKFVNWGGKVVYNCPHYAKPK